MIIKSNKNRHMKQLLTIFCLTPIKQNILLILGITLIIFILVLIFRKRTKTHTQLILKNNEIQTKLNKSEVLNEHLLKLGRFKQAMTGMIEHDLRTPLNIIIKSDNITYTKHAGRHMLMMVQNILDIQKFEEERLDININNDSIYRLAQKAIKEVSLLIETKKINVTNNISQEFGVLADTEKTKRIFVNILTNAIKYSSIKASITLNCEIFENKQSSESDNSQTSYYKISIRDTGDGIPANKIDVIFDIFEQVKTDNSGEIHSTGIGLTFCKLAVEAQGGIIWAESELNKGSVFLFTLPKGDDIDTHLPEEEYKKIELILTSSDKKYLEPFIDELKELEVYDISEAEKILEKIDSVKTNGIAEWKNKMKNTLFITDEDIFAELLALKNFS